MLISAVCHAAPPGDTFFCSFSLAFSPSNPALCACQLQVKESIGTEKHQWESMGKKTKTETKNKHANKFHTKFISCYDCSHVFLFFYAVIVA